MKKTTILITALIMLFVSAPQAKASPMYYTFEGNVVSYNDGAGAILAKFGSIPTSVTYTIIIDFAADGTQTYNDTSGDVFPTSSGYFYADAYSGDYLLEVGGGAYNADGDVAEYNYGHDYPLANGILYVNSDDELMYISSPSPFSSMTVNYSGLTGEDYAYNNNNFSFINSSLKLISKSATPPPPASVPEPSTLLLLGSGLLALGMFRRMRQEG